MPLPFEYQKIMTEIVYVNLPGPDEPALSMSGMELLHGFVAEFGKTKNPEVRAFVASMCLKWNVHFRTENQKT
jgi:hypothetical protein